MSVPGEPLERGRPLAHAAPTAPFEPLTYRSSTGRWVVVATVLGSGLAQLDATVVNVALPRIGEDLGAGLTALQWTINAYTLTLSGLLLLGGSLGDRLGRRRMFALGVVIFTLASAGCAAATNVQLLIAMRAVQGLGGALLTPGSLAILQSVFRREDRAAAVGAWTGLGGVATAIGPVLGGLLISAAPWGWRLIFLINLPLAAAVLVISRRFIPETRNERATGTLDVAGAVLASLGLAALVYGLTEGPGSGWAIGASGPVALGIALLAAFVVVERKRADPLLPFGLFRDRRFSAANLVTFAVYAALTGGFFLVPIQLQLVSGFGPIAAGSALLPITLVMLLGSAAMGRLATRIGPRLPMTVGPIVAGAGLALMVRIGEGSGYLTAVLPAVLVFAVGLTITVAPLTATVLAAAPEEQTGIASAINNDVARVAGLLAVAVLPPLAGITQDVYADPAALSAGFARAVLIAGGLCALGGVIAALTIRNALPVPPAETTEPTEPAEQAGRPRPPVAPKPAEPAEPTGRARPRTRVACPISAPSAD